MGERFYRELWRVAGELGVDPFGFTARELLLMAEGRRKEAWSHTGSLLAMIHNALSKHPLTPEDFNPYSSKHKKSPRKENVSVLRDILFDKDAKYKVGR